jgi:hypothetical protein
LWEDGVRTQLPENLTLTMFPGMRNLPGDTNLKTLIEGIPEFVDVIRVADNKASLPLKLYLRAVDHDTLLKSGNCRALRRNPGEHLPWLDSLQSDQFVTSTERATQGSSNEKEPIPSTEK